MNKSKGNAPMRFLLSLLTLILIALPVEAGFSVRPTSLYLTEAGTVTTLYLTNNTKSPNVYQVGAAEWIDRSKPTAVAPTEDIAISPRVLRLMPGQTGRVRVQASRTGIAGSGKAYRVLARQVAPRDAAGDLAVNFTIQFNVPLLTQRHR